jgi:outer membrane protein TolC
MAAEGRDHGEIRMKDGTVSGTLKVDLALERTAERNAYRNALVALEAAVRAYQKAEDDLKATIRQDMRSLSQTREQLAIQSRAVELAARRVRNQDLLLEAGRADMTDLLDAQAALLAAQNSLDRAITDHRVQELSLRRDIGALDATADGVWTESDPL